MINISYILPPLKAVPKGVFKMAWKIKALSYLKVWNIACVEEWLFWSSVSFGVKWFHFKTAAKLRPLTLFWTFDQGKNCTLTSVLIFCEFQKYTKSLKLLNMNFENNLPKGIFGQNIRDSPNGSLTADSRSLPTAIVKEPCHNSLVLLLNPYERLFFERIMV